MMDNLNLLEGNKSNVNTEYNVSHKRGDVPQFENLSSKSRN